MRARKQQKEERAVTHRGYKSPETAKRRKNGHLEVDERSKTANKKGRNLKI
jgi:hypothetical protein